MGLFKEAQIFITKQRIKELENAIRHWPDSDKIHERTVQLSYLRSKLDRQINDSGEES